MLCSFRAWGMGRRGRRKRGARRRARRRERCYPSRSRVGEAVNVARKGSLWVQRLQSGGRKPSWRGGLYARRDVPAARKKSIKRARVERHK